MKKRCTICEQMKELEDFHKNRTMVDGCVNQCKACVNTRSALYRKHHISKIQQHDRARATLPHRIKAIANYRKTKRGMEVIKLAKKTWADNNPEKKVAQALANKAIQRGLLKRGRCVKCNSVKTEAHHPDYSKPLEVVWVCHLHHMEIHRNERGHA